MPHFLSSGNAGIITGRGGRLRAQRFNREEEQAAQVVGGFSGQQRREVALRPEFAFSSREVRQARLGRLAQFGDGSGSIFGTGGFSTRTDPQGGARARSRFAQAQRISTSGPGFLAGQGFSLQPLGFNIALSEFQDEEELFTKRTIGGFLADSSKLGGRGRGRIGGEGKTLLTGQIRRRKLTIGGSVIKGPIVAPTAEQPSGGFGIITGGNRFKSRAPPTRAPRRPRFGVRGKG